MHLFFVVSAEYSNYDCQHIVKLGDTGIMKYLMYVQTQPLRMSHKMTHDTWEKKTFVNISDKAAMRNFHYSPLGSAEVNNHVTPIHHAWYLGMMVFIRVSVCLGWGLAFCFYVIHVGWRCWVREVVVCVDVLTEG